MRRPNFASGEPLKPSSSTHGKKTDDNTRHFEQMETKKEILYIRDKRNTNQKKKKTIDVTHSKAKTSTNDDYARFAFSESK